MRHRIGVLPVVVLATLFILNGHGLAGPVPDTGQMKCYGEGNEIACPQPGEAFYGQDGSYLINPPSYAKLDAGGIVLADSAAIWAMVRDNVTGLIWEVKTNRDEVSDYSNPHDADNTYTWYDSNPATNGGAAGTPGNGTDTEDFIAALNAANFGGFSDWRLPIRKELRGIVENKGNQPTIDNAIFPNTQTSDYWSATPRDNLNVKAWIMNFENGFDNDPEKSDSLYVRAVRGGRSESRFVDNRDGTVTDTSTGLMWQQATAAFPETWARALSYCEGMTLAGYTDWRLPNINELDSIVSLSSNTLTIDANHFPDTRGSYYWSATTFPKDSFTDFAAGISFGSGYDFCDGKSNFYYVRAVRGGQYRSSGHLAISNPVQGSAWLGEDTIPIRWDTAGSGEQVRISISTQGGREGSFQTIADATANDGTYDWQIAGIPFSTNCVLKIEPINDAEMGTTQGLFSITRLSIEEGYELTPELWAKAVLKTQVKEIDLVWKMVGRDITPSGALVVSGYFYADPDDFAYGSPYNPEVFVKIYIDPGGWCNLAFSHVTVDDVAVYTAHNFAGSADQFGTMSLVSRLLEHSYTGVAAK